MKFLCIIPARCGSKGIPHKNIIDVDGKPLIQYTIEIAKQLKDNGQIKDLIVSTDCKEVANISERLGVRVPFFRPGNISGDKAKSVDYIIHAVNFFEKINIKYDAVIVLQPTSPLKKYDDIVGAIDIFNKYQNDSLISVYKEKTVNNLIMYYKNNDEAIPLSKDHNQGLRRQDHGAVYVRNGAIYIVNIDYIKKRQSMISDVPLMYEMSKNNSINIDGYEDLEYVRNLLCK
jgi:CMP-N,N'-diacetyllegionaminic acid synthase